MALDLLPQEIRDKYEVHEWKHAIAILATDFPDEWQDILDLLQNFRLCKSWLVAGGGNKSSVSNNLDAFLYSRNWDEKHFDTFVQVDEIEMASPTHKVDCFKNGVALEIEWNNKDPFFDRDLNNFRLLFELRVISVGVIITRSDELQQIFNGLGRGKSYGNSTTHMSKLLPRVQGGGGGGCPLLVFGIKREVYSEEC